MASYNRKIIRTGSYIEVYEYEYPIISDFKINKKVNKRKYDELTLEEKELKLKRLARTRQQAKWNLLRLIDTNFDEKTSFLTLTTKENIIDRNEFNSMFDKFIARLNYNVYGVKKRLIKYVAVLEKQKRGAWHTHILLFSFPFIPHSKLFDLWGHGSVRINKVHELDDISNAGRYVVKYMEKGIGQELIDSMGKNLITHLET